MLNLFTFPTEAHLALGVVLAILVAFVRAFEANKPPEFWKKVCDALLCGFGAYSLCLTGVHYKAIEPILITPVSISCGWLGMIRVRRFAMLFLKSFCKKHNIPWFEEK